MIQICRKRTGALLEALNSLWRMPLPALIICTSPGRMTEPVPIESSWARAPSSTYEKISMSRCGWVPKPWPAATRSSLITSRSEKPTCFGSW